MATRPATGDYYKEMRIQPWEALEEWLTPDQMAGYLIGSAIVYLARFNVQAPGKGGVADVCKAQHYLDRLIEVISERYDLDDTAIDDGDDDEDEGDEDEGPGSPTDHVPGPPCVECPSPKADLGPGHLELETLDDPSIRSKPDDDGRVELEKMAVRAMVARFADDGMSSAQIAGLLNANAMHRPDGHEWTPYQVAMIAADIEQGRLHRRESMCR